MDRKSLHQTFDKLLDTIETLREKCPWDAAQTPETIRTLSIEEVYELSQAILKGDPADFKKELGDVLLHIVLYSIMADERHQFNLEDVMNALYDKLIFRHPHIFGDYKAETPEEVSKMWEMVKLKEKGGNKTVLGGIPESLPAMIKAYRLTDKASGVGFDWDNREEVWKKVAEEMQEFDAEIKNHDQDKAEGEFGDLLFAMINAARLYDINPDTALERTNRKFTFRFNYIEQKAKEQERSLKEMTLAEMDALWNEAKKLEKK